MVRKSFVLVLVGVLALSVFAGCTHRVQGAQDIPVMNVFDAKRRSLEIQRKIETFVGHDVASENDFQSPDEEYEFTLLNCAPILSEQYSKADGNAVQYPGMFAIKLDRGVVGTDVIKDVYKQVVREYGQESVTQVALEDDGSAPIIYTRDGFQVRLALFWDNDAAAHILTVDVWSPCFIPEGGTLPPGRKI